MMQFEQSPTEALKLAENALSAWAENVSGINRVVFDASTDTDNESVQFRLVGLESERGFGGRHLEQLTTRLNYAVGVASREAARQRAALLALFIAAHDHENYQLTDLPMPANIGESEAFTAGFVLAVPVGLKRRQSVPPRVTSPTSVQGLATKCITGRITGPGGLPIPQAVLRIPRLDRRVRSNEQGIFHFDTVPADLPLVIEVEARGKHISKEAVSDGNSLIEIEMDF